MIAMMPGKSQFCPDGFNAVFGYDGWERKVFPKLRKSESGQEGENYILLP